MADSTIDSNLIQLVDSWPGVAVPPDRDASDMTSATVVGHNVAVPVVDIGTKWAVYNVADLQGNGVPGPATFIYLQVGTQNAASLIAAKSVVVQDSATVWYQITNDPDDCVSIPTGLAAIALSAVTDAYYAWFWCGGVCPELFVPDNALGGNYATESNVVAGPITAHNLTADYVGLGPCADTEEVFGYALAADA